MFSTVYPGNHSNFVYNFLLLFIIILRGIVGKKGVLIKKKKYNLVTLLSFSCCALTNRKTRQILIFRLLCLLIIAFSLFPSDASVYIR